MLTAQVFWSTIHGDGAVYARIIRDLSEMGIFSSHLPLWSQTDVFAEHPYLFFYFSSVFSKVFGYSDLAMKIPNFITAAASMFLVFRLAKLRNPGEQGHAIGLIAAYVLILNGSYIMQVSQPSLDPFAHLLSLLAVIVLIYKRQSFLSGLILGFAFLTKGLEILPHLASLFLLACYLKRQNFKEMLSSASALMIGVVIPPLVWLGVDHYAWNGLWLSTYWDRQFTNRFFNKANMNSVFNFGFLPTLIRIYFFETVVLVCGLFKSRLFPRKSDPLFFYFLLYLVFNSAAFLLIKKDSSQHVTGTLLLGAVFVAEYLWELRGYLNWRYFQTLPAILLAVALAYWGVFIARYNQNPDFWTVIKKEAVQFDQRSLPIVIDESFEDLYGIYHTAQWYYYPRRVYNHTEADRLLRGHLVYLMREKSGNQIALSQITYQ